MALLSISCSWVADLQFRAARQSAELINYLAVGLQLAPVLFRRFPAICNLSS